VTETNLKSLHSEAGQESPDFKREDYKKMPSSFEDSKEILEYYVKTMKGENDNIVAK